jgi:iron complex transport system ATP-binding protein
MSVSAARLPAVPSELLSASHLGFGAGGQQILDDVSFVVAAGEVIAVVGPNGAGKSTLLRLLAGDLRPGCGEIAFSGRPLGAFRPTELAQRRAVVPQNAAPAFDYRVLEVVLLGRSPHSAGAERERDLAIAVAALAEVEARSLADRRVATLSGGERQRVDMARALAQVWEGNPREPALLLLDEPTSALDLARQHAALASARRFASRGNGVVAVLHDLNLAAQYADRLLLLCEGEAIAAGCALEVLDPVLLEQVYGVEVHVVGHPCLDCPQVFTLPRARGPLSLLRGDS